MKHTLHLSCLPDSGWCHFVNAAMKGGKPDTDSQRRKVRKQWTYLPSKGEQKLNVVYKTIGKRDVCLDIYYPAGQPKNHLPTLIYTHGGGWAAGSKQGIANGRNQRPA